MEKVSAGVRLAWAELPAAVRQVVEERAGARVVAAQDQVGGFSPGVAARLRLADGGRLFVKAVSASLNPDSPGIHRAEAAALAALPASAPVPRLAWTYDDGDWVVLGIDDIEGRQPYLPWRADELDRALGVVEELAEVPGPDGFPDVRDVLAGFSTGWPAVAEDPPALLDPWAVRHLDRLGTLAAAYRDHVAGSRLVHLDLRADNLLRTPAGDVYVLDWAHACVGAAWVDLVIFLVSVAREGGYDPDALLLSRPVGAAAPPAGVDALVCLLAGFFTDICRRPAPPGLPTIRAFQRDFAAASLNWLRQRLDR